MAANIDRPLDNGHLRPGMDCRGTLEKIDESTSWYWVGDICHGPCTIHLGVVDASKGKDEKTAL